MAEYGSNQNLGRRLSDRVGDKFPQCIQEMHDLNVRLEKSTIHIERLMEEKGYFFKQLKDVEREMKEFETRMVAMNNQIIQLTAQLTATSGTSNDNNRTIKVGAGAIILAVISAAVGRFFGV